MDQSIQALTFAMDLFQRNTKGADVEARVSSFIIGLPASWISVSLCFPCTAKKKEVQYQLQKHAVPQD